MVVTFVTSSNLKECTRVLDNKRLGKQRVEARQILDVVEGKSSKWGNHPMAAMWKGHANALKLYINAMIIEWKARGFKNTMAMYDVVDAEWPWWWEWKYLHLSHQCNLLRKNPAHYTPIFKLASEEQAFLDHGYIWTSKLSEAVISNAKLGKAMKPEDICVKIGAGAPAQYRWTREQVLEWVAAPTINPKTHKKINLDAKKGTAADIRKAAKYYGIEVSTNPEPSRRCSN